MEERVAAHIEHHLSVAAGISEMSDQIAAVGALCAEAIQKGGKILLCGNGGSAGDAQHIAAELVGRFVDDRPAMAAIALTTDTSALTAIANDYGYDAVFSRQVEGLARPGDVLIGISTSGNSPNVNGAMTAARDMGCATVGLTGKSGGALAGLADHVLVVATDSTARIQECHILIGHILCDLIETQVGG